MAALRLYLSAAALGKAPPPTHLAERRKATLKAWDMVPQKLRPAARAALGTLLAVRSVHQPQLMGFTRNSDGKLILVWGSVVKVVESEGKKKGGDAMTMEDLTAMVKELSAIKHGDARGKKFSSYGAFHLDGAMRSPDRLSEPVEDLLCSTLNSLSILEMNEVMSDEAMSYIEGRLDSGGKFGVD